jgi:hypothetical protein
LGAEQRRSRSRYRRGKASKGIEMRNIILGALAVGVIVLGYLYYVETKDDASITIQAPKIETPR